MQKKKKSGKEFSTTKRKTWNLMMCNKSNKQSIARTSFFFNFSQLPVIVNIIGSSKYFFFQSDLRIDIVILSTP